MARFRGFSCLPADKLWSRKAVNTTRVLNIQSMGFLNLRKQLGKAVPQSSARQAGIGPESIDPGLQVGRRIIEGSRLDTSNTTKHCCSHLCHEFLFRVILATKGVVFHDPCAANM